MKYLDDITRARLKRELSWGQSTPSPDRYQRTMQLQREILEQYGRRGAEFIMAQQGLMTSPDDHGPWQLDGLDSRAAVDQVLAPVASLLPRLLATLRERIRYVIPARRDDASVLVYVTDRLLSDGRPHFQLLVGGAPNNAPQLAPRATYTGWQVPASLRLLCSVHDGFAVGSHGVLAARRMADLGEIMEGIDEEQPAASHACRDLLEFHPDGAGNCQAFFRCGADDPDPGTVFWDHELNELHAPKPFFEYVDDILAFCLRDETQCSDSMLTGLAVGRNLT